MTVCTEFAYKVPLKQSKLEIRVRKVGVCIFCFDYPVVFRNGFDKIFHLGRIAVRKFCVRPYRRSACSCALCKVGADSYILVVARFNAYLLCAVVRGHFAADKFIYPTACCGIGKINAENSSSFRTCAALNGYIAEKVLVIELAYIVYNRFGRRRIKPLIEIGCSAIYLNGKLCAAVRFVRNNAVGKIAVRLAFACNIGKIFIGF